MSNHKQKQGHSNINFEEGMVISCVERYLLLENVNQENKVHPCINIPKSMESWIHWIHILPCLWAWWPIEPKEYAKEEPQAKLASASMSSQLFNFFFCWNSSLSKRSFRSDIGLSCFLPPSLLNSCSLLSRHVMRSDDVWSVRSNLSQRPHLLHVCQFYACLLSKSRSIWQLVIDVLLFFVWLHIWIIKSLIEIINKFIIINVLMFELL